MASSKTKRGAKRGANMKRRPTWSLITFAEIERWRTDRGLPKRRMAEEVLGVTNSTYHNWARGTAVPTENAQRKLLGVLKGVPAAPRDAGTGSATTQPATATDQALLATTSIVNTYLETHPGKLSPDQFTQIVRDVRAAVSR